MNLSDVNLPDAVLFLKFCEDDCQQSLATLHARHNAGLLTNLRKVFRFRMELAEEVAQDAWIAVVRERETFDSALCSFDHWLWTRAKLIAFNRQRRARTETAAQTTLPPTVMDSLAAAGRETNLVADEDTLDALAESLNALPTDLATVIRSVHLKRVPLTNIAMAMNLPESTLRGRIVRAMEFLRDQLTLQLGLPPKDGRSKNRGASNGQAKLSDIDALAIKNSTEKNAALARRYGVSEQIVSMVKRGKRWQHVQLPQDRIAATKAKMILEGTGHRPKASAERGEAMARAVISRMHVPARFAVRHSKRQTPAAGELPLSMLLPRRAA